MLKPLLSLVSPAGARARLSILILHRVLARPDPLFPDEMHAERFDLMCAWLRAWFNVMPLDEAVRCLREVRLPARAVAITFDDGYADNHDVAMPILKRHGLTATVFVTTGVLDGGLMWNDMVIEAVRGVRSETLGLGELAGEDFGVVDVRDDAQKRGAIESLLQRIKHRPPAERLRLARAIAARAGISLPADRMMSSAQVRAMHQAGMGIGAHTVTHPILAVLDAATARAEMADSKRHLEALLQAPVGLFAYPNGRPVSDYDAQSVRLAREVGFDAAVTTTRGACDGRSDLFQLPRFTPWDRSRMRFGMRILGSWLQPSPVPLALASA